MERGRGRGGEVTFDNQQLSRSKKLKKKEQFQIIPVHLPWTSKILEDTHRLG